MSVTPEGSSLQKKTTGKENEKRWLIAALLVMAACMIWYLPGILQSPLNSTEKVQLYFAGDLLDYEAVYEDEVLYLPYDFIKDRIDPGIAWDEKNSVMIITTSERVFHFPLGKREGLLNLEPYSFTYPVIKNGEKLYAPAQPLADVYDLGIFEDSGARLVRIRDLTKPVQEGSVIKSGKLRHQPLPRSSYAAKVAKGERVSVMKEDKGWFWVETEDGRMGYLEKGKVELAGIKSAQIAKEVYPPWNPLEKPLMLTWEYAAARTANPKELGALEGVQVLSPTWFHLAEDGLVLNRADKRYADWAHQTGRQVWALFDNGFNPELTGRFLSDAALRIKVIKQLLSYVDMYRLDGINLDFENMRLKDKAGYVQFVRELAPLLHEKERSLSIDVTFLSNSENWSLCYDRKALGEAADYLVVMGYDEHGQTSPMAGSVSSLPWVENGLINLLKEAPPEKIILGMPFYTRLWQEEVDAAGQKKLTSRALSMEKAALWISENGAQITMDERAGQHYVELTKDGIVYKMWLEDESSLANRVELMKKHRLAGLAAWRRGFESPEIWPALYSLTKQIW